MDYAANKLREANIPANWILKDDQMRKYIIEFSTESLGQIYVDDYSQNVNLKHAYKYILCNRTSLQGVTEQMILDSALELHCFSAAYVILCLSFCNMNFKSFDTSIKYHENLNRLIISLRRDSITPNLVKPDISEIRAEHKYVAEKKSVGGEEEAFLTQLGVHYFRDNKCSMRTQALKVSRDKKWSTFTNFSAFSEWLETGKTQKETCFNY